MLVWQAAREEAQRVRREFGTSNPYTISRALGIRVSETPMPEGVSGMIVKQRGEDARIFIDASHGKPRRLFTCAHELGHFIDRTNIADDDDFSFRDVRADIADGRDYDLHEFFADEFAGELLMPADQLLALQTAGATVTTLAARFGVSASAVKKRLRRLEINPPAR